MKAKLLMVIIAIGFVAVITPRPAAAQEAVGDDNNLQLAVADFAGFYLCDYAKGKFRPIKSQGRDNEEAISGTLWVHDCSARSDGETLDVTLHGKGWRWIYREREKLGGEFEVSQYGSFDVSISMTGELDTSYEPSDRTLSLSYTPFQSPHVDFQSTNDLNVDSEGLWSSVLAGAASLAMQSPDSTANQKFETMGKEKFSQRFAKGYEAEIDFCSGRMSASFVADKQDDKSRQQQDEAKPAYMHDGGLIVEGPFDPDPKTFAVHIDTSQPLRAELVCEQEARVLAEAKVGGKNLPQVNAIAGGVVEGEKRITLDDQNPPCSLALVMQPADSGKNAFEFSYHVESAPLLEKTARCGDGNQSAAR